MKRLFPLLLIVFHLSCQAGISVNPLQVYFFADGQKQQQIQVTNTGKTTAYVKVTPWMIQSPGTEDQTMIAMKNPKSLGLLVTPQQLVLQAGQTLPITVQRTQESGRTEHVYQIAVQPMVGKLVASASTNKQKNIGLKVLVGYGVRTIILPENIKQNIRIKRDENHITISNKGTVDVLLHGKPQCYKDQQCKPIPTRRLYPGNTWKLLAPYPAPVTFEKQVLGKRSMITSS